MINLQHLYLDEKDSSSKVIFQDQNSQIVGIKFKKKDIKNLSESKIEEISKLSKNCCIYFLYGDDSIYIGKSVNGIDRIKDHVTTKEFWRTGLMFVTDNTSWTSTTIDYLEHHFINLFKGLTELSLENLDTRTTTPNITLYYKATIQSAIKKVEFYLNCHNINTQKIEKTVYDKIYKNKEGTASLSYDGEKFILIKGSQLMYPLKHYEKVDNKLYKRLENDFKNYSEKIL